MMVHQRDQRLRGSQITGARLDQALTVTSQRPASAVDALPGCPFAAIGEQLLRDFDTAAFEQVLQRAGEVLRHHLDDAANPAATLGSGAAVLAQAFQEQDAQQLGDVLGTED